MTPPFHANHPASTPFYGRQDELARIVTAIQHHGYVKAAVMAGRGMGKTSFALRLSAELIDGGARVFAPRVTIRSPAALLEQLGHSWGGALDGTDLEGTLGSVLGAWPGPSVVVLDEIEGLLSDPLAASFWSSSARSRPRLIG